MKNKNMKVYLKYLFIFFLFLFWNLFLSPLNLDEIWSYGFTNNLYLGLIPYRDFNMVITPFYPMIMCIPMFLFGSNMLVFHIENAILITFTIFLMFRIIGNKTWYVMLLFLFPINFTFPNYNFLLLFFFILLVYLEKTNSNDYLIGIIIALSFLTKQTVGIFFLLPSLYYLKRKEKIFKRIVGFMIPNVFFLIYLIVTNSFRNFIDLCLLGLIDFGEGNHKAFSIYFFISITLLAIVIWFIKKEKKQIHNYYLLSFYSLCLPLFDLYHLQLFFIAIAVVFFMKSSQKFLFNSALFFWGISIGIRVIMIQHNDVFDVKYPNSVPHFEYRLISNRGIRNTDLTNQLLQKYHYKVMFIGPNGYYFKIINNRKIDCLDLINTGNFGYHGSQKLLNRIQKLSDQYVFFVELSDLGKDTQTDQNVLKYVLDHGSLIEKTELYYIYKINQP